MSNYSKILKNERLNSKISGVNKSNILTESEYTSKIMNYIKNDPLLSRVDLKNIYSISKEEYHEIVDYEVSAINSLKGEIFDTSDPKWIGTSNYEFTFEVDKVYLANGIFDKDESVLFSGDVDLIDIDVDVDVNGTVYLYGPELDDEGRDWTIREATSNSDFGWEVISEIRDIIRTILEQRLPELNNLKTLQICNVEEDWVTKLSNHNKPTISEGSYSRGSQEDLLNFVYNELVENTKWRDSSFSSIDLYDGICKNIQVMISWGSVAPYFIGIPECLYEQLENIYGLNHKEIDELFWGRYDEHIINMVLSKKENLSPHLRRLGLDYLNESVDKKFLHKVVAQIVDETILDYSEGSMGTIKPPFTSGNSMSLYHFPTMKNTFFHDSFFNHCKNTYGIKDDNEMEYIWEEFVRTINDKVSSKGNLNESQMENKKITISNREKTLLYQAYTEMGMDQELYEESLIELLYWLNNLPNEIILYRLLYIDDDNNIDEEFIGDHYTTNKRELLDNHYNKGSIYGGGEGDPTLLRLIAKKEQIDVFNTLFNNIYFPHEEEVTLKNKGKGSTLLSVKKLD